MKKNLLALTLALLVTGFSLSANATIIENVHLTFQSGGVFNGTVSFYDNYEGMFATSGTLSGGANNYNDAISWTWWAGTGQTNPQSVVGLGTYTDWLMNGIPGMDFGSDYTNFIGLTWDPVASSAAEQLQLMLGQDPYYSGMLTYNDPIVAYNNCAPVPEPSTYMLLGVGLAGVAYLRRKRNT